MAILRFILILNCILFFKYPILSQNTQVKDGDYLYKGYNTYKYELDYREIDGSPYRIDSLIEGQVMMIDGAQVKALMRFNIYEDEVEYLDGQKILIIENTGQIDHIILGKDKMVYRSYDNDKRQGYFIEKIAGNCSLYVRYVIEFEGVKAPLTSYHQPDPPAFINREPQWYVSVNDGPLEHLDLKISELEHVFGEHLKAVKGYKKQAKLKFGREEDVVVFFEYFNQLLLKEQE